MSAFEEATTLPQDFSGKVRLFPLPNLVLFPHVVQPLHIFEPRYCDLLEEALAGDGLIAMVLLETGWQHDYAGRPAIAPVACLSRILSHERVKGGRHNILLRGLCRAAIRRELPAARAFRQADVDLLEDFYPSSTALQRPTLQRRLIDLAASLVPADGTGQEPLMQLLESDVSLGMLSDIFSYTLGFPLDVKQRLLTEWNVDRRATLLADRLAKLTRQTPFPISGDRDDPKFPPRFSLN